MYPKQVSQVSSVQNPYRDEQMSSPGFSHFSYIFLPKWRRWAKIQRSLSFIPLFLFPQKPIGGHWQPRSGTDLRVDGAGSTQKWRMWAAGFFCVSCVGGHFSHDEIGKEKVFNWWKEARWVFYLGQFITTSAEKITQMVVGSKGIHPKGKGLNSG